MVWLTGVRGVGGGGLTKPPYAQCVCYGLSVAARTCFFGPPWCWEALFWSQAWDKLVLGVGCLI